jgi:hypothetical protein
LEQHLVELGELVRTVLFRKEKEATAMQKPAPPTEPVRQSQPTSKRKLWLVSVALVAGLGIAGWWFGSKAHQSTKHETTPQPAISTNPPAADKGVYSQGLQSNPTNIYNWFVVLDADNGFYASPGVPNEAINALKDVQLEGKKLVSFAFTRDGNWVIMSNKGVVTSAGGLPSEAKDKNDWQKHIGRNTKCLAFAPNGTWIILDSGFWGPGNPAWARVKEIGSDGSKPRSVAYGLQNGWVVLYDEAGISYGNISDNLTKVLDNAVNNNITIECVAFTGPDWICLGQDNFWTSNPNLPAAKFIDKSFTSGQHPKWIAFVPYF